MISKRALSQRILPGTIRKKELLKFLISSVAHQFLPIDHPLVMGLQNQDLRKEE